MKLLSSAIIRLQFQSVQYLCLWPHPYLKVYGCRTLGALDLFLSSRTPTSTSWECCASVSVGGCVHVLHARTYVFPSVSICMFFFFFRETSGLAFLQEECLLKVFTADSYFIRRVCCRKLKRSIGTGRETISLGGFRDSGCTES